MPGLWYTIRYRVLKIYFLRGAAMDRSVKNFLYYVFFFGVITYIFKLAIGFFQLTTLLPLSLEISTSERWLLATTLSLATLLLSNGYFYPHSVGSGD